MTLAQILEQAATLTHAERVELIKRLADTLNVPPVQTAQPGWAIAAWLRSRPPIETVHPEITDPVAWVAQQRAKEAARRSASWMDEA